ncbi:efflux transporter outer membrane subunit [bacterium BD-1]|nr:efflux transporter outer membrane subunit [Ottowia caeni]
MLLLAVAGLAACAQPLPPPGSSTVAVPTQWSMAEALPDQPPTDLVSWWGRFGDATLSALIEEALGHSPTVQSAVAALRQSRAMAGVAAASLGPSASGSGSAQRNYSDAQGFRNSFGLGLDASWEPDLFGGTRAGVEAAEADARATEMALVNVQVSLAAEVALAYIDLRNQQARLKIARENLAAQDDALQIASWRNQAGLVSSLDVELARAAAEQTRAQVPLLQTALSQTRNRLAVLTGRAPADLAALPAAPVPLPPENLALAFPADTLRQRPDVRQAEAQVQAAYARTKQAGAARYPSLRLGGSIGLQSLTLGSLLNGSSVIGSLLAGLTQPIFDGGAIAGRLQAQEAALDQARAAYGSRVLQALQDVEDALAALQGDRVREGSLNAAATAARNAELLARQQYQAGLIDFNTVLQSQRTLLSAQDAQASVAASLAADHVRLYKALGGGWPPEAASAADAADTANANTMPATAR